MFAKTIWSPLCGLDDLWNRLGELGAEDCIPETVSDSKSILVVHEMVLHMPFLRLLIEGGKFGMVEEVVCQVVHDISEYASTEYSGAHVPVEKKYGVGQFPERIRQGNKECRRHDKSIFIHRKVVVDAVKKEVQSDGHAILWEISGGKVSFQYRGLYNWGHLLIKMEEEAVKSILYKSP